MSTNFKEHEWRLADRLNVPASVLIAGQSFQVVDWSFAGFSILRPAAPLLLSQGESIDLIFVLPFGHYAAQCGLQAELRVDSGDSLGFEFGYIPEGIRLLMREYVEEYVEGRLNGRESKFTEQVAIIPESREAVQASAASPDLQRDFRRNLRRYGIWVAVFILLLAWVLWSQRFVSTDQAGMVGNTVEIRSQTEGFIKAVHVKHGQVLPSGQLMLELDDHVARRNLAAASFMQQRIEAAVKTAEKALADEKRNDQLYAKIASGRLGVEQARQRESEVLLAQTEADLKRAQSLHQRGFISESSLTDRVFLARQREALLARAKTEAGLAVTVDSEARKGRFFSDRQVSNRVNEMAMQLESYQIQHAQALVALGGLMDAVAQTRITAPQGGRVRTMARTVGELVRYGDLLATLETEMEPYLLAKLSAADAVRVRPGQSAQVYFPALDKVLKGTVASVGGETFAGNAGLQSAVETNANTVLVSLRLELSSEAIAPGLRARVEIDTGANLWVQLRQRLQ